MIDYKDIAKRLLNFVGNDPYDPDIDWSGAEIYLEDEQYDLRKNEIETGDVEVNHLVITNDAAGWMFIASIEVWREYMSDDIKFKYYGNLKGNVEEFEAWLTLMRLTADF